MPGLNLGIGGGAGVGTRFALGGAAPQPATLVSTAYGQGSSAGTGKGLQNWHLGLAAPVALVGFGVFVRWSLPPARKSEFDLAAMTSAVTVFGLGALVRLWSIKEMAEQRQDLSNTVAEVAHAVVG